MDERMTVPPGMRQSGFTVIEVLIALLVLLIGMAGILSLQLTSVEATGFSRHATEASLLAEDKMEWMRTQPLASLASGDEQLNALGVPDPEGFYERAWEVDAAPGGTAIVVRVSWVERGDDSYTVTLTTKRTN